MNWKMDLLVLLASLPLFLFHMPDQDWGDDAFQYLLQSERVFAQTPNLQVHGLENYGPEEKGLGFSLLLGALPRKDLKDPAYVLVFFLILAAWCFFRVLQRHFAWFWSLLLTLVFLYAAPLLHFRGQILPEYPFLFVVMLMALLLHSSRRQDLWLLPVLCGLAIALKSIGWVLYVAGISYFVWLWLVQRSRPVKHGFLGLLAIVVVPILVVSVVHWIMGRYQPFAGGLWYGNVVVSGGLDLFANLQYYWRIFHELFERELPMWANTAIKVMAIGGVFSGFLGRIRKGLGLLEWSVLIYIIALLLYPDRNSGLRFLLPLWPVVLFYFLSGCKSLVGYWPITKRLVPGLLLVLLFSNLVNWCMMIQPNEVEGPNSDAAKQMFSYIRKELPDNALVGCSKPWAVLWYGRRSSFVLGTELPVLQKLSRSGEPYAGPYILDIGLKPSKQLPDELYQLEFQSGALRLFQLK